MKKSKILIPALSIASVGAVATPMLTLTSCNKSPIKSMTYDEAKEWVKATWGEAEGKEKYPQKAVSTWDFAGEITTRKTMTEAAIDTYHGYWRNHFTSLICKLGYLSDTVATQIKATYSFQSKSTTFNVANDIEYGSNVTIDGTNFYKTLTAANFDETIGYYFTGLTGKKYTKFIVDTEAKTLKATGLFYAIQQATESGTDFLTMPDCTVTFGSEGQMTSVEFNFGKYAEAEYVWLSSQKATWSDWFDFTLNEGGKITVKYNYA